MARAHPTGAKLFIGGISPNTNKEVLDLHFSRYGNLVDSVVMVKDGKQRGFGFVTFENYDPIAAVLSEEQIIDGRVVDVKEAVPAGGEAPIAQFGMGPRPGPAGGFQRALPDAFPPAAKGGGGGKGGFTGATDKVFIGGIPNGCSEEHLMEHFGVYGAIVDVVVMKDRMTQKSRGFGFVRYDNFDSVELVMADVSTHNLHGKWVDVKRAVPQDEMAPAPAGPGPAAQHPGLWAMKGGAGGFGGFAPPMAMGGKGGGFKPGGRPAVQVGAWALAAAQGRPFGAAAAGCGAYTAPMAGYGAARGGCMPGKGFAPY